MIQADWIESEDSLEEVNLFETEFRETKVVDIADLNVGDYLFVKFLGENRNTAPYRYSRAIQNIYM